MSVEWKSKKLSPVPGQPEGWYAMDGDTVLYCGQGHDGESTSIRIANLLNLGQATLPMKDAVFRENLMKQLRVINHEALDLSPDMLPEIHESHQLYPVVQKVGRIKNAVAEIQKLILER